MKGIELAQLYYAVYGKNMIREKFPEYEERIAVGLVGQGSECFGYDDILSADHDFGPGFCMWLTDEDYEKIGEALEYEYEQLPKEFMGYKKMRTKRAGKRDGVMPISLFYESFVGNLRRTSSKVQWLKVSEKLLATVTNGKVFRDDLGEFTKIRQELLEFYPRDVRLKKMVARAAVMAQAGQYNYPRCMKRSEYVAASMALNEFVAATISMVYLINGKYAPYYKWMHKGMHNLDKLSEVARIIEELITLPVQKDSWKNLDEITFFYGVNFKDKKVELIEKICEKILKELQEEGLIANPTDPFLELYVEEMMQKIQDPVIKCMHVMEE